MATYACEGIILRRQNFGEADRLVVFFSDRFGKIRAVAKGIRRPTSKMSGSLELFSQTKLRLAEGKNLDIIVESNPIAIWRGVREHLERFELVSYLGELVDKTTQESESHAGIYRLLVESLQFIDARKLIPVQLIVDYFRAKLLADLGYEPQLNHCAVCHDELSPGQNYWSSSAGGVVCGEHQGQADRAVAIADNTIKMMRLMINRELAQVAQIEVNDEIKSQTHRIINDFFDYHFDINLKSKKYVEALH